MKSLRWNVGLFASMITVACGVVLSTNGCSGEGEGSGTPFETCLPGIEPCLRGDNSFCQAGDECYFRTDDGQTFECSDCEPCADGNRQANDWCLGID